MQLNLNKKVVLIILGILLSLILLEIGLRISGYIYLRKQEHRNLLSLKKNGEYRILCLGESTTMDQWPEPLEKILNSKNNGIKFSVIDTAIAGTNTGVILSRLNIYINKYKPDLIIAMIGINDSIDSIEIKANKFALHSFRVYKLLQTLKLHFNKKIQHFFNRKSNAKKTSSTSKKMYDQYINIGDNYFYNNELYKAILSYTQALNLDPKNYLAYAKLGQCYRSQKKFKDAVKILEKSVLMNPYSYFAYSQLGGSYYELKNFVESAKAYEQALKIQPENHWSYIELGEAYRAQKEYRRAAKLFKKAITLNPDNNKAEHFLLMSQQKLKNPDELNSKNIVFKYFNANTMANYKKIKNIAKKHKIKLLCVQYPMISIEPLKEMLKPHEELIFTDNEMLFKDAVAKEGYDMYFKDRFAGNFGHCTDKGNQLLAQNIADTILRELEFK